MKVVRSISVFLVTCGLVCAAAVTPNQFSEGSDSDRIEAAIAKAIETGDQSIEIPRLNVKRKV